MGKQSRQKRERRALVEGPVARILESRSRGSVLALLEAASVSPNASQYLPSLAVAYECLAKLNGDGDEHADPDLLQPLIDAAHKQVPSLAALEDFLPHDPRYEVRIEWAGDMHRMVAGALERPTSNIESLRRLSAVIDPVLHAQAAYGLIDAVELVLRRVDAVATALAPTWPSDMEQVHASPPQIIADEIAAAARVPRLEEQIAQCGNRERARAALEAHSVPARRLRRDGQRMTASFGNAIAVRHGQQGITPLPAGLMVEALSPIAETLTGVAHGFDPSLDEEWRASAWQFIGTMLVGAGNEVIGPVRDSRLPHLHSLVRYTDTQYLAVGVATAFGGSAISAQVEAASRCLASVAPGSAMRTINGVERIPASAHLCRLLIVAQPYDAMFQARVEASCAMITLQDFDWIRSTDGHDQIDLWYFVRDCISPKRLDHIVAPEVIDKWEAWKSQGKSFYTGARELTGMFIAPGHSLLEWQKASERRDIERTLNILGMGQVCKWPWHDLDGDSKVVGNARTGVMYRLIACETPVAVALYARSGAEQPPDLAHRLGNCVAHKLDCSRDHLVEMMRVSGLKSLRIEFEFNSYQQMPLRITEENDGILTVDCAEGLQDMLRADTRSVEDQLGVLLAAAIAGDTDSQEFVDAWRDASPGIRVDLITVRPIIQQTPQATSLHQSHRSTRLAELGAHLEKIGIGPGTYEGDSAKRLETDTIYPWLIMRLHDELAPFDHTAALRFALTQLEFTNSQRWWKIERTAYDINTLREDDSRFHESSQDLLNQARFVSLIVEEVLARPPTGNRTPTEYEWQELLCLATLAGESSARSEALHRELATPKLIVNDLYQVTVDEDDIIASVDLASFSNDHRIAGLPSPRPIGSVSEADDPDGQWVPFGGRLPAYANVDQSLQQSLGFGLDAILIILDVITQWPVSMPHCTDLVHPQQIAAAAYTANPEIPRSDYEPAVDWLSLNPEELVSADSTIRHWEVERRSARVAVRPLIQDGPCVWILPWTAEIARRAWFTYLSQMRMPIPDDALPSHVADALRAAREVKNRDFERECLDQLADLPMLNITRVRERRANRHCIAHLSGEIDILSVDSERSLIFIVEAKDPFVALSARAIHQQITQFHKEGGYVDKLEQKVQDIDASASSLAATMGIEQADRDWRVIGIIVTRHVSPAAYHMSRPTTFCTIHTLRETVASFANFGVHSFPTS